MASPMDTNEQPLGSFDAKGNVPLLNSPNTSTGEPNDEAIDLFLSQVAAYDTQQLFEQVHGNRVGLEPSRLVLAHEPPKINSTSPDVSQLTMHDSENELLTDATEETVQERLTKETKMNSSVEGNKSKAKGKASRGGTGSSLLNAFANPLLHAIPVLARNCLNFEDYLAQAALHGQNGLLGPKVDKSESSSSDYTTPDKLLLDPSKEKLFSHKVSNPYHIRVLGLPPSGAKSRVETQIKICIQLINSDNELCTGWSHLRLPEHMVAKDKLKRKNQKSVDERSALIDSKILNLEAAVVCDSHPDNEIIMCTSCVHRERKRLKRKRDNKIARAANKDGSTAKLAALFSNALPDLSDEKVMADERRKILLFNCNEYVEFGDGEVTLPTRITCYCRHHSEKVGFRIVFTVKDSHNHVVATGRSPPIMITDDHKSSKVQTTGRKRSRAEFDSSTIAVKEPLSAPKKKAANTQADGETDSGISSPVASTPPTPTSQNDDMSDPQEPPKPRMSISQDTTVNRELLNSASNRVSSSSVTGSQSLLSHMDQEGGPDPTHTFDNPNQQLAQGPLYDLLHSDTINMDHLLPSSGLSDAPIQQQLPLQSTNLNPQPMLPQPPQPSLQAALHRRRHVSASHCAQQQLQAMGTYAKLQQKSAVERARPSNVPRLHRLIPSEGPVYGGSEVTVLGSNFYEGLTCVFGENPAIPTHCWSPNTLLCILPPAQSAGPVVVSFKEHPLILEGQDVVLFTYFDESDRALMELALQVVGLKTLGRVEDARQIAMRIVQGDSGDHKDSGNTTTSGMNSFRIEYRQNLTAKAAMAVYENAKTLCIGRLEEQVIAALVAAMRMETRYNGELSLTNRNQHSLLHLATLCGYDRLVRVLVNLGCDVDQSDHNGFTALHFASWTGKVDIVEALIAKANLQARNIMGKTAEKMALEAGHLQVLELLRKAPSKKQNRQRKSRRVEGQDQVRIPLTDFIPSEAVETARAVLPTRLTNMFSTFYTISANTPCIKNFGVAVGQVYNFMLDPF